MKGLIRLAPDPEDATLGLSKNEALTEANAAFQRARKAQARLVSHLDLSERLADPGQVGRPKLRGMLHQAEEQVERAQAVVQALIESMEALERYRDPTPVRTPPAERLDCQASDPARYCAVECALARVGKAECALRNPPGMTADQD